MLIVASAAKPSDEELRKRSLAWAGIYEDDMSALQEDGDAHLHEIHEHKTQDSSVKQKKKWAIQDERDEAQYRRSLQWAGIEDPAEDVNGPEYTEEQLALMDLGGEDEHEEHEDEDDEEGEHEEHEDDEHEDEEDEDEDHEEDEEEEHGSANAADDAGMSMYQEVHDLLMRQEREARK